jgi:hypothetical protein
MQKCHDEDSRKLNPDSRARLRSAKMAHVQKGIYANRTDIHGKPTRGLVQYSSREREKKGNCEETDKRQNTDTDSTDMLGLIKFARLRTSHLTPRRAVVIRPTPSPPCQFVPHPLHRNLTVKPRTKLRSLLRPRVAEDSFSVQQPCESHVWQPSAVTPKRPQPGIRPPLTPLPTPRSAADHMLTL